MRTRIRTAPFKIEQAENGYVVLYTDPGCYTDRVEVYKNLAEVFSVVSNYFEPDWALEQWGEKKAKP